jgi:hypothetical protein
MLEQGSTAKRSRTKSVIERGVAAQWEDLEAEIGTVFDSSVAHGNCRGWVMFSGLRRPSAPLECFRIHDQDPNLIKMRQAATKEF